MALIDIEFDGIAETEDHIETESSHLSFVVQGERKRPQPARERYRIKSDKGDTGRLDSLGTEHEDLMSSFDKRRSQVKGVSLCAALFRVKVVDGQAYFHIHAFRRYSKQGLSHRIRPVPANDRECALLYDKRACF